MEQHSKEILDRDRIHSDLHKKVKSQMLKHIGRIIYTFLGCVVAVLFLYLTIEHFFDLYDLLYVILMFVFFIPLSIRLVIKFKDTYLRLKAVNNKEYSICEDTVTTVAEREKVREKLLIGSFGRKDYVRCLEDALYFQKYGRVAVNHGVCAYTIKGDIFYVVVLDNAKDCVIVNAYSEKIYDLKYDKM